MVAKSRLEEKLVKEIRNRVVVLLAVGMILMFGVPRWQVFAEEVQVRPTVISEIRNNEYGYQVIARNIPNEAQVKEVRFAVWSDLNGQDDLVWYSGQKQEDEGWTAYVNLLNHREGGSYQVHTYVYYEDGSNELINCTSFGVSVPFAEGIKIENKNESQGTFDVRVTGANAKSGIYQVRVAAWNQTDQSDLEWYVAARQSDGSYVTNIDIANHKNSYGTYNIYAYAIAGNGVSRLVQQTTANISSSVKVRSEIKNNEYGYQITAEDVPYSSSLKGVRFAVWSELNGQDDKRWYQAKQDAAGKWTAYVDLLNHREAGKYQVHTYADLKDGSSKLLKCTTFEVSVPFATGICIENKNESQGTFDVRVIGANAKSGIYQVWVAAWNQTDQSDLKWYAAARQSDGSYVANIDIANHKNNYGTYYIHAYAIAGNGVSRLVQQTTENISVNVKVRSEIKNNEYGYQITAEDVPYANTLKGIRFAVWSDLNGQDDKRWYQAKQDAAGKWTAYVDLLNHREAGKYQVHTYADLKDGSSKLLKCTTFYVSIPSAVGLSTENVKQGIFDVTLKGAAAKSGIYRVRFAVWSKNDQSDLYWYEGKKIENGTYTATVERAKHSSDAKGYQVHAYVIAGNGVERLVKQGKTEDAMAFPTKAFYLSNISLIESGGSFRLSQSIDDLSANIQNVVYLEEREYNLSELNIEAGTKYIGNNTRIKSDIQLENIQGKVYFENVEFTNGLRVKSSEEKTIFLAKNCKFMNGKVANFTDGNGFESRGSVFSYLESCVAENNQKDGFNYHGYGNDSPQGVESNCIGRNNGGSISELANFSNGSSLHGDCMLIRINCEYYNNVGNNVHDIENAKSWNINCRSYDSKSDDNAKKGDFVVYNNVIMWCYKCKTDNSSSAFNCDIQDNGHIYVKDCEFSSTQNGMLEAY